MGRKADASRSSRVAWNCTRWPEKIKNVKCQSAYENRQAVACAALVDEQ